MYNVHQRLYRRKKCLTLDSKLLPVVFRIMRSFGQENSVTTIMKDNELMNKVMRDVHSNNNWNVLTVYVYQRPKKSSKNIEQVCLV